MSEEEGRVTIAPSVLTTIVRMTALETQGVHRLATHHAPVRGLRSGTASDDGVIAAVTPDGVRVEVHVVATPNANLLKLGETLQASIRRAIEHMVGMPVHSVDVHIEGVALDALRT